MKVITFQNYRVAKEINEKGIFKNRVRREWVEEKSGLDAINALVKEYNKTKAEKIEKPVFGLTEIKLCVEPFSDDAYPIPEIYHYYDITVDDMSEILTKHTSLLGDLIGVDLFFSANVMMCLDVPDEYVLEYNQQELNNLVHSGSLSNISSIFETHEDGITSCIMPYIKKEWVKGIYAFTTNLIGDLLVMECNAECTNLKLHKAVNVSQISGEVFDVTSRQTKEYTFEDLIERFDKYNGWECQDEFDKGLCLEYLSKHMGIPLPKIKEYAKDFDESKVFESIIGIMDRAFMDL